MKIEDIIALTNAGWGKDEILRMAAIESPPVPKPAPEPEPKPTPEPEPKPAPEPENETIKLLKELTGLVRMNNINNINQPDNKPIDAAEVLAKIMNP